ncbi:type II toxin-antitoxin system RelB/ParD family antitoxin [Streptococcus downei]|uniref:Plasmid stabilization system, antitoxin protein n=1 Tax=Streptococcus downei MFe28 TaxID=764290 RepID=A0A380JCI0_STRDO|nr:hypothetical protein [Streptococcus downei]EFQ56336.1 addiction module antitoxin, RelB/DinJ family [Streptococcus downei F0415]SUN35795.1 plasmid stabilization system, antitoxin protein [Streptococcus downei MFe28]
METLAKNSQFTFRTNEKLLAQAKEIVKEENMNMSALFNKVLETVVEEDGVPAGFLTDEKSRHQKILDDLYGEIQQAYDSYKTGLAKPIDEVFEKYGL